MARLPVEVHPAAAEELERAYDWYAERSVVVARAFVREVIAVVDDLAESHGTWPRYSDSHQRRVVSAFPFSVIYRVVDGTVQVIAFAHHRKRPGYWHDRG